MPTEGAKKFDTGKLRYDLVPVGPIEDLVRVFTAGASKYGDRNWEQGLSDDRLYAALMRHIMEWRKGNRIDPEYGLPHMAHAMWNVMAIMYFEDKRTKDPEKLDDAFTDAVQALKTQGPQARRTGAKAAWLVLAVAATGALQLFGLYGLYKFLT